MTGSSPCESGEIGSLYIGGVGLSPGYWNDPPKTAEVFHPSQPGADSSDRIYKTGDLARIGDDGLIYLVGRADSQVKIRGFRIELREIEAAVHAVSGVQDAAVVAVDSPATDGPVICCAFVAAPLWELSPLALKREVSRLLPHYMIPTNGMASRTCRVTRTEKRTACGLSSGSFATAKPAPFRETTGSVPLRAALDKRIFNAR